MSWLPRTSGCKKQGISWLDITVQYAITFALAALPFTVGMANSGNDI